MGNIIRFILNNLFAILFVLLELLSFHLIRNQNSYQRASFFNAFSNLKSRIHNESYSLRRYLNLNEINYALVQENKQLRNYLKDNYKTSITDFISIDDSIENKWYDYEEVKIINNSTNKQHNYITLNKGSIQGIEPEMGVISSNGVVGIVHSVSRNFALVLPILNSDFKLSSRIKRNNYFGSLSWDGSDYRFATLNEIPYHVELFKGDTIVTSGFSPHFPEGIIVGFIEDFEVKDGNFYTIKVLLANDFKQISNVYVIDNLFKDEQINLEKSVLKDD